MNFKQLPNGMSEGFALLKKCDVKDKKRRSLLRSCTGRQKR